MFVVMDLGVDDAGSVIERGMDESVANRGALARRRVAAAMCSPAAVRDPSDLLDINMDQLTGTVPDIAPDGFCGCPVTLVESGHAS